MPRGSRPEVRATGGGDVTSCVSMDLVRALLLKTNSSPANAAAVGLTAALEAVEAKAKQGEVTRSAVRESRLQEELLASLDSDLDSGGRCGVSSDLAVARARLLKIKLLNNVTQMLAADMRQVLQEAVTTSGLSSGLRPEEKVACLSLLATLVSRVHQLVVDRLAEVLGYLTVMAGMHDSGRGEHLVPTNLPYLHFTRTTNSDQPEALAKVVVSETSESELSDSDLVSDTEFRMKRIEALVQKEALSSLALISKRCSKKEVVPFWFLFLSAGSFSPLSGNLMDLVTHSNKRVRYQALAILTDFLCHCSQFLALAQHSDKPAAYTALSTALAAALFSLHALVLGRLREQLCPTEIVALLKLLHVLTENCSYSKLAPGLIEKITTSCFTVAREERNPVIQVACLSVFSSLCQHCATDPAVLGVSCQVFDFMMARAKPDKNSLAPDNNVRYMALQAGMWDTEMGFLNQS